MHARVCSSIVHPCPPFLRCLARDLHLAPCRILGLDPGLQVTGYAVLEVTDAGPKVCEAGVIRSAEGRDPADMARRIKALYDGLCEVLDQWKPAAMAVEQLYAHYDHPRTAILMAHARGAFFLAGAQRSIPVVSYAATKVKKLVTGSGRASKEQMQHAIARELGLARSARAARRGRRAGRRAVSLLRQRATAS